MGVSSWLTADTGESIPVDGSCRPTRPVYMLQPDGAPPVLEPCYQGYGTFGEVHATDWLAANNLPARVMAALTPHQRLLAGIGLDVGHWYLDVENGSEWIVFHDYSMLRPGATYLPGSYATPVAGYSGHGNNCPNSLRVAGRWVAVPFRALVPLKFSFSADAVYEALPPSKRCPHQGLFYPEMEEDEDLDE